jgi:two-component system response regulator HupR/HoxA
MTSDVTVLRQRPVEDDQNGILAVSAPMRAVMQLIDRAASCDTPILLVGESGTGKELLARALHRSSPRSPGPFVAVNCAAIPETLLESELFGHRRGAFTDARADHPGLFQSAQRGTIFLDEIGDMATALQGKLLRVLQEKEVHPLGAPAPVPTDVRVVAATHRDLPAPKAAFARICSIASTSSRFACRPCANGPTMWSRSCATC